MNARPLVSICILALALPVFAQQAPPPVMKEGQITESALIDALTPDQPLRTRSLRVMRTDETGGGSDSKPASANLLITFDTNSAGLTPRAKHALDIVGQALASDKLAAFRFSIEGHADPRGAPEANMKLSQARADSVRDYLVNNKNIDGARLEPVGKGDQELINKANPIAPENRRVTIVNLAK